MSKKINLKNLVNSSLDEEFELTIGSIEPISNVSEDNEINSDFKNKKYKPIGPRYNRVRDKGDWEIPLSDLVPPKGRKRVGEFTKLPNGLTPNEMMYGTQDDDYDIIGKSLE